MWDFFVCMIALLSSTMSQHPRGPRNTTDTYQITENIVDIPDNRTLAPIDPTYGIQTPLNFANNTINNIDKTTEYVPITNPYEVTQNPVPDSKPFPGTYEVTENKPQEKPEKTTEYVPIVNPYEIPENKPYEVTNKPYEKPDQNNNPKNDTDKINLKKNTFSILHVKGEFDNDDLLPNIYNNYNKVSNNNAGFKGFLDSLKSYLYSMKKGLVDGLYKWYHKDEARKEIDKFYRSFNKDSDDEDSTDDDVRNWIHRDEVKKEIEDFYKHFNDESDEESEPNGPKGDESKPDGPKYDETAPDGPGVDENKPNGPDGDEYETDDDESNDDDVDVRFGEQYGQDDDHDYDYHHYHHRRHGRFGDCH